MKLNIQRERGEIEQIMDWLGANRAIADQSRVTCQKVKDRLSEDF